MSDSPTSSDTTLPVTQEKPGDSFDEVSDDHQLIRDVAQASFEKPWLTSIPEQPQTEQRKPFIGHKDERLSNAGTARAVIAASRESPNGTTEDDYAARHEQQTVVQQHCEYWDTDHDGIIWPWDTYVGCRKWGMCELHIHSLFAQDPLTYNNTFNRMEHPPFRLSNLHHQLQPLVPNLPRHLARPVLPHLDYARVQGQARQRQYDVRQRGSLQASELRGHLCQVRPWE